jgi:hypothetical protein
MGERAFAANKHVSRDAILAVNGRPQMIRAGDTGIPLLMVENRPFEGATTYLTGGLSDVPVVERPMTPPLGAEVIGVCDRDTPAFPQLLAEIVLRVRRRESGPLRHEIMPDLVPAETSHDLRHVWFVDPAYWESGFEPREYDYKTVAWLLAVPISEGERLVAERDGSDALALLLDGTRVSDLRRKPVA